MDKSCRVDVFYNIPRSEYSSFVLLTTGLWCTGEFLVTVIFLLNTGFALTFWGQSCHSLLMVGSSSPGSRACKTPRGPFSTISLIAQEPQHCLEVTVGSDSACCSPGISGAGKGPASSWVSETRGASPCCGLVS